MTNMDWISKIGLTTEAEKQIRQEVSLNDHGEAYRLAAIEIGRVDLAERFERLNVSRNRLGYLSPSMELARANAAQELQREISKRAEQRWVDDLRDNVMERPRG